MLTRYNKILRELKTILTQNNCLQKFTVNLYNNGKGSLADYVYDKICNQNTTVNLLISNAFIWKETTEGFNYWENIENKWANRNKNKEMKYNSIW